MSLIRRLFNVFRSDRHSRDIDRELEFHLAERVDALVAGGMSPAEARSAARRMFGNVGGQKERTRDSGILMWLDTLVGDLEYLINAVAPDDDTRMSAQQGLEMLKNPGMLAGIDRTKPFGAWASISADAGPADPPSVIVALPVTDLKAVLATVQNFGIEVDNKPGRSGNIATEMVVRAPADGYTILLVGPANAISGSLYPNLAFNFLRDIAPVAGITREALVMVVHPSVPSKTVPEFLSYVKANRGKITMASTGNGSSPHVTGELFKLTTKLDLNVVHYAGGGPALKAMIEGQAQVMFEPMSASIEPVRSDKLRALAVTTALRAPALWTVPLAFGVMVVVSLLTQRTVPANVSQVMLRMHLPETLSRQTSRTIN